MSIAEVASVTGLTPEDAGAAQQRDFDEPFLFEGDGAGEEALLKAVSEMGFRLTRGRFMHLIGDSDKGKAVSRLITILNSHSWQFQTIALGDGPNDLPMLRIVEHPVIVQGPDGGFVPGVDLPNLIRAEGIGPVGWNRAILNLLEQFDPSG